MGTSIIFVCLFIFDALRSIFRLLAHYFKYLNKNKNNTSGFDDKYNNNIAEDEMTGTGTHSSGNVYGHYQNNQNEKPSQLSVMHLNNNKFNNNCENNIQINESRDIDMQNVEKRYTPFPIIPTTDNSQFYGVSESKK